MCIHIADPHETENVYNISNKSQEGPGLNYVCSMDLFGVFKDTLGVLQ